VTPFRAEVVGSMLRPSYLKKARVSFEAGELDRAQLDKVEDRAVDEVIALQEDVGLDVVTDGEMRRRDFMAPLYEGVHGAEPSVGRPLRWKHVTTGNELIWHIPFAVTGKLRPARSPAVEGFAYARRRARMPVKQSLASPLLANWGWNVELLKDVYADPFELLVDAAALVRQQALDLAAAGCTYIQIDAPDIAALADPSRAVHPATGIPVQRLLSEGLELVNSIPQGIGGVTFAIHLCRGNIRSHYITAGGYGPIARALFQRLTGYDVFLLEYDDERAGGFEPLADCPEDKTIVLGLVSSKRRELEDPDVVVSQVAQAAAYHPHEQLALSTQCGFATELEGNHLSEADQRAKLRLVAELAHRLWT
jgi:5-methyltetrahydropteroyltriglutamate--homocysteine methyltransferase